MIVNSLLRHKGREVVSLKHTDTVRNAAKLLAENRIGACLVMNDDGGIEGVLSERDIVRLIGTGNGDLDQPVSRIMTRNVITCSPDDSIESIMSLMTENRIRHLPVMEGSDLAGIISIGDVVRHRLSEMESESQAMREYIASG